ncbi:MULTISPECIES: hypothetical protein [unclassified Roseitalea]|uniref:hypothetical protein n=1 Tax=unclassified Roseitalea TaxID=2639107 RepID=UPI00273ED441|nr:MULTISPECIES: hypothetical protein [unclassified Roseitalea]
MILGHLRRWHGAILAFAERGRGAILAIAASALAAGIVWAIGTLGIVWDDVNWRAILAIALIAAPVSMVLNASELRLCARAAGRHLGFRPALQASTIGVVSNLLPVPASIAIRGKALAEAGVSLGGVGKVLGYAAAMWIALAVACTGLALPATAGRLLVTSTGLAGAGIVVALVLRQAPPWVAVGLVAVRASMIAILVLSLFVLLAALNVSADAGDAAILSGAGLLGTIAGIAPAGLGITELAGAGLATLRDGSAAGALVVLALHRLIGLTVNGTMAVVLLGTRRTAIAQEI